MEIKRLYSSLYPQKPLYVQSFWQWLRLSRWWVYLHMRLRMILFMQWHGLLEIGYPKTDAVRDWNKTKDYWATPFARRRFEHLIYVLRSIPSVSYDSRILCIGPRNEGELLLLMAHGFKNVRGIDLYTYSPLIDLQDMHATTYMENTFDVLISSYAIRYAYDLISAIREMVRIVKPAGIIAVSFAVSENEPDVINPALQTSEELLTYFSGYLHHVYWQLDDNDADESELPEGSHEVVFKVMKS